MGGAYNIHGDDGNFSIAAVRKQTIWQLHESGS